MYLLAGFGCERGVVITRIFYNCPPCYQEELQPLLNYSNLLAKFSFYEVGFFLKKSFIKICVKVSSPSLNLQ